MRSTKRNKQLLLSYFNWFIGVFFSFCRTKRKTTVNECSPVDNVKRFFTFWRIVNANALSTKKWRKLFCYELVLFLLLKTAGQKQMDWINNSNCFLLCFLRFFGWINDKQICLWTMQATLPFASIFHAQTIKLMTANDENKRKRLQSWIGNYAKQLKWSKWNMILLHAVFEEINVISFILIKLKR